MNLTSNISLLISKYAFLIAILGVIVFLMFKFLGWYFKNKKKIYKFRDRLKRRSNKNVEDKKN